MIIKERFKYFKILVIYVFYIIEKKIMSFMVVHVISFYTIINSENFEPKTCNILHNSPIAG